MRRVVTFNWLTALMFITALGSPASAASDPASRSTNAIAPVVVTATRSRQLISRTPFAASVRDTEQLRLEKAVRTVPESLDDEPGTMVQKTGHGQGSPYMRGFTGYRNLMMVDGVRLNNSVFRDGPNQYWNTVDAFGLDSLEVVRGPFSALYGSDAIGGTVNAMTRGVQSKRPDSSWDRRLYYRYASAENSHIARAESIGDLTDKLSLTVGYTLKDFGDLEGGKDVGTQEKTGYDEQNWDVKLEYFLDDDSYLTLSHQGVDQDDAWRTHKTIYGIDWEGLSVGKELRRVLDQERELTALKYDRNAAAGFADEIHAGISHQHQGESRERDRTGDRYDEQGFDVHTVGAFVTLKSVTRIGDLVYGAEVYHDEVDSYKHKLNADGSIKSTAIQGPVGDDATYDTMGLYVQDEAAVSERLRVILGGRYEFASADADSVEDPATGERIAVSGDWDDIVGSARALYSLDENGACTLYAGVSQGFRAPNLSDLTRLDSGRTDEIETPSPDLDPEHFVSSEIGFKAQTDALSVQASYYYTVIDGMIIRTVTGEIIDGDYEVTKKNAGDGYVQGLEFSCRYNILRDLALFGSASWMDGRVDTYPTSDSELTEEYIDRLMPPTGRIGLRWDVSKAYWAEVEYTAAAKADKLSTRDQSDTSRIPEGGTPSYTVVDARVGWNVNDNTSLSLAVENIADEDYRIHGSGVNEPGRNLVLAADITF